MPLKLYRRCVSCQCISLRDNFWRVVRVPLTSSDDPTNHSAPVNEKSAKSFRIQMDNGMGRSAYICKKLECLQIAQKKNRLGRSLRTPVPHEIFELLKSRL